MKINRFIDHTLLKPFAAHDQLKALCDEAKQYEFASVCVNPCHAAFVAKELAGSDVKTCCVVGFPFGTHLPEIKLAEAKAALRDGAQELVISVGHLLEGDEAYVEHEVQLLADACHEAGALLKVIIETCYLEEKHIAAMCRIVEKTGADFMKTSTGYGTRGASPEDIELFCKYLKKPAKMKASGGIRTAEDAKRYIEMGCERLGTSNGVAIMQGMTASADY